ncbi:MAG: penicillin-binding transpeptidase domain-containing protein [Oscillospiraceae bacterium]|nr:penicillin-binding transpeptidase domain-containing protein [Oscillospiraceae bacterium]
MIIVIAALTLVSFCSLVYIMIYKGDEYQSLASEQQLYDNLVTAPRGDIYDKNMNVLATSSTAWTVYITPNGIKKLKDADEAEKVKKTIAEGLSSILEVEYDDVYSDTEKNSYYVIVKKKIEKSKADEIRQFISDNKELKLNRYIGLDETTKRYYPNDTLASSVIGFVGDDNQGLAGLESYYDNDLTGVAGRVVAAKNAVGTDMPFTYEKVEEAKKGNSLVLTIDSYVQYVSEKYLDIAIEQYEIAERGAVMVMNVNTGEMLGMAVSGDYNPNSPFTLSAEDQALVDAEKDEEKAKKLRTELLNRQWRNKAVSDTYEPGSVFKIFTAATAIEENLVNKNSSFGCHYTMTVAGRTYHCHKVGGHGNQLLKQAISNSCNPAFITIGQLIGVKTFAKYFEAFGLTAKTGIDLPGEALPYYHKEVDMGPVELSSSSFGQTFNITPLQMISLAAASVNGGYLVQPHMVQKIIDADGKVVETMSTGYKRQVISKTTSETMREMLEYVVQNGAKNGIVSGYRVGGKTGTSQKMAKILETGNKRLYIGSYVGIAPIDDPEIAVFVMLDEPKGASYYGGAISAPVGSQVMTDVLPYLGFEPQYTDKELEKLSVSVPDVVGKELGDAKGKITTAKLSYKVIGTGEKVVKQLPEAGEEVFTGGTVILYTDESEYKMTKVPDLVGLSASKVNKIAAEAGINIEFSGNTTSADTKSYSQSIEKDKSVPIGTVVTVYFRDEGMADVAPQNRSY